MSNDEEVQSLRAKIELLQAFVFAWDAWVDLLAKEDHVAAFHANTAIVNARFALEAILPIAPLHTR